MECISHKTEIEDTFYKVRGFSYDEKRRLTLEEQNTNLFLDAILQFKTALAAKTEKIYEVNESFERLTWLNDLNEECLMLINDLISSAKDLYSSLLRQSNSLSPFLKKGIAKEEIESFKNAIDELKESYTDLESVFFFLPKMPDFIETTKKIALI